MKKLWSYFYNYLTKDKELEIKMFKILGLSGIIVSLFSGFQSIFGGISVSGGLVNFLAAALSALLMWFVDKTHKYVLGYVITEIGVFMILFAVLFFEMGGMSGSMTYFFSFGLVFSFLMFRGPLLAVMESLQVAFYLGVMLYAYAHPEKVTGFDNEKDRIMDSMVGIILSGVGIGLIFLVYIYQFEKAQKVASEASKAKSRFLANMSHELRTPINMMLGINEMISRESNEANIREYTDKASIAGNQLLSQVNQLLDFSKLDAGKGKLKLSRYNLFDVIDSLREFYEKEADAKGIEFKANIDKNIKGDLKGDVQKITQILTNLLSNAIKYTKEGSVTLTVESRLIKDASEMLYFEVKDTGIGIKDVEKSKIFDAFERADIDNNRNIEGTGLGLAIAQAFAEALGGKIEVVSKYGVGSTFSFCVEQFIATENDNDGETLKQSSFIAPDARILVVDDNRMNLDVVKSLLKRTLMEVSTAESGDECVEMVKACKFDCVLLDYMMPVKDGIATLKEIKLLENGNIPIVVLTADVSEGKREMLLNAGFDDYLSKPIDSAEMEAVLRERLPAAKIVYTKGYSDSKEAVNFVAKETELLNNCYVDLKDGLKHFGNDLSQYVRISEIFADGFERVRGEIAAAREASDYRKLIYLIHSLKGNAGNVGATELRSITAKIEDHLRKNDNAYFDAGYQFMMYEYDCVANGLVGFAERYKNFHACIKQETCDIEEVADEDDIDVKAVLCEALKNVESNNKMPAIRLLDRALTVNADDIAGKIVEIKELVSLIEFEKAAECLENLLKESDR